MKQFVILAIVTLCLPLMVTAKSYSVTNVSIRAEVQSDGSVVYTEARTYAFKGAFSQADYNLPLRGFEGIRDIQVREEGVAFTRTDGGRDEGTFFIRERSNRIDITWNYRAKDEERTFEISYILDGALIVGPDYAEFMWTFISDRWEKRTEQATVEFVLTDAENAELYTWIHGADDRTRMNHLSNGFQLKTRTYIPRNRQVIVRTVFPTIYIPQATVTHPDFTLQTAIQQEEERELSILRKAEHQALWYTRGQFWGWILLLLSPVIFFSIYLRHGRRHQFGQKVPDYLYAPPMQIPPAVAGKMLHSMGTEPYLMTATLFDLARRGYFKLFEVPVKPSSKWVTAKQTLVIQLPDEPLSVEKLLPYERHMYDFLLEAMVDNRISLAALFESSVTGKAQKQLNPGLYDSNVKPSAVTKWYTDWIKELGAYMKRFNWYEAESTKWMWVCMGYQALIIVAAVVLLFQVFVPVVLIAFILGIVWFIASAAIRRRTLEAQLEYDRWKAYRNGLLNGRAQDFKNADQALHLIYAIALYISGKKFVSTVENVLSDSADLQWIMFTNTGVFNPAVIAQSVSNITTATTSSFTGGGAGVGVAGGGAGGGAR